MNTLEKIFSLIIRIGGDKQLQSLYDRLKNILSVIREIGNEEGLKKVAEGLKVYDTVIKDADKSRKALVETGQKEKAVNEAAAKVQSFLVNECKNLTFTKRELATIEKNYIALANSEKRSVEELQAQVNILNIAWKKMGQEQRNSTDGKKVTADLKSMREEIRQLTMAAGDNSRNIGNYVSGLYNAFTSKLAMISGVVYTIKRTLWGIYQPFQDLEYRMSMVKAVTQATEAEFVALEAEARRLGAATQYTATQVAELEIVYGQLGFTPAQIIAITETTLDLATATGEDLAKSADAAGVALREFNLDVSQMPRVVDVMTLALNKSALKLDIFGEALKYVGPIADKTGVSFEECSALIGTLADQGIRGSMAGTSLRRILSDLAQDGRPLNERLAELSKTGISVTEAMDEVGKHAMTALAIIGNDTAKVDALTKAFKDAAGAAKAAADITRNNMRTDGLVFLSALQEKLIAIGEYLSPLARAVIQFGTSFVSSIKEVTLSVITGASAVLLYNSRLKIKAALEQMSATWAKANSMATALNTASLSGNTVALLRNLAAIKGASAATQILASVKLLLTGQIKAAATAFGMLTKTLVKNPFGLIAVGLASVVSYFVFFRQKADAAADAQKRFNDENDRFNKTQDEKRQRIEQLIRTIQDETETEYAKVRTYEELQRLSPVLTDKYTQEQIAVLKLAESTKILNEQRDEENYTNTVANVERLTNSLKALREEHGKAIYDRESDMVYTIDHSKQIKDQEDELARFKKTLKDIEQARQQAEENNKPIEVRIKAAEDVVQQAESAFAKAKAAYQMERDRWIQEHGSELLMPFSFRFDMLSAGQSFADAQKSLANLKKRKDSTVSGNGAGEKDKGEWSLSKDKAHNDVLLKLKEQLYSGEITSDEAYNKRVLALEIDTLAKRIALNTDGNKVLIKLRNELADKRYQLQKTEKKEAETTTADEQAHAALRLKYENDHIDAGIAALKDGVDKRVQLNDQATNKALQGAEKSYKAERKSLDDKQEAYREDSAEYQAIEQEKARLAALYGQKRTDIETTGADARVKILRDATEEELQEYAKVPGKAAEVERQITENKRREVDERLKLARKETEQTVARAGNQYDANEAQADVTIGKSGRKRNVAGLQNEIQLHRDLAQAYQKELDVILSGGDKAIEEHKADYDRLIKLIGTEQNAAMNLGKGKTSGGERKSIWKQFSEMSDEDINQLKQQAFDLAAQIGDAMIQAQQQASQRRLNNEKKTIDAEYKIHSKLLDSKRDKGLISEKTYQKEMEKLEAEKAKKEEEAERAAFEREKKLNIAQAWMNVAVGIAKIWAEWGTTPLTIPVAVAQTAILTAQGVIQTGFIAAQKFAQGGIIPVGDGMGVVKGRSHAQGGNTLYIDGRPIGEIEHDELIAIVNKHDTRRIGALSAANSVHGRKFASGGLMFPNGFMENHVSPPVSLSQLDAQLRAQTMQMHATQQVETINAIREDTRQQIEAINQRIDTLKVVVVESDITEAQNNIKKIKVRSTW